MIREKNSGCISLVHIQRYDNDVIDVVSKYPCLGKQIHIPMQSGDDKVLIRMNRKHSMVKYRSIIEKIKSTIPQSTIFTDIITGFTGGNGRGAQEYA